MSGDSAPSSPEVDHSGSDQVDAHFLDLHSRNIASLGLETMTRMASLRILILGCGGVGVEAAKNLALAGVHTVALYDHHHAHVADMGVNFALTEADVQNKVTRAQASARLITELNPVVRLRVVESKALTLETLQNYDCVIVTAAYRDLSISELDRINQACRSRDPTPVAFMLALTGGNMASFFTDYGASFITRDLDGRAAIQKALTGVEERVDKRKRKYTLIRYETPEGMLGGALRDYTQVTFSGVKGLTQQGKANGKSVNDSTDGFKGIQGVNDPKNSLRIYPSLAESGYTTPYAGGGFITEVKEQVAMHFDPFIHALRYPKIQETDPLDFTLNNRMHAALISILLFATNNGNGHLPQPHNKEDADKCLSLFKEWNAKSKTQSELDNSFNDLSTKKHVEVNNAADSAAGMVTATSSCGTFDDSAEEDTEMPARPPPPRAANAFFLDDCDLNEDFVKHCARLVGIELQPMAAFIGAVVAQEVVKLTGKFTPVQQFLCFDYSPALPTDEEYSKLDIAPRHDRYDNITRLYGRDFAEKLHNLKIFMPGCGALGCEDIKNFALLGMCCGKDGKLTVTDNDRIEVSNLSRQFLFREDNVGHPKSVAAANRALDMNKSIHIDAKQDFVGNTTEHIFDDVFWDGIDVVVNALDNMPTRVYVDGKCVFHQKVLVEAGTTGTAGNIDIINPGKTTSYTDGGKADETGGIPMCTLRNFPYIFEHCIEWARAQFEEAFVTPFSLTEQISEDPHRFIAKARADIEAQETEGAKLSMYEKSIKNLSRVESLVQTLTAETPSIELCAKLAWKFFHEQFRDRISALVELFPRDAQKKNGEAFWSGHRTFPTAMQGDLSDPDVRDFMISATNLFACMFGVHPDKHAPRYNDPKSRWMAHFRREDWIRETVVKLGGAPPRSTVQIDDLDEESKPGENSAAASSSNNKGMTLEEAKSKFEKILDSLSKGVVQIPSSAKPLEFEKDDDDNFHIDFVAAASNLRAKNYQIETKDRMQVKIIAGKIIPAIATTTAAVCGLSMMEYFKVLLQRDITDLRNGQIDIGCNSYVLFDREPPSKNKTRTVKTYDAEHDYTEENKLVCCPEGFTKYDRLQFDVSHETTVGQFVDMFSDKLKELGCPVYVASMAAGTSLIWRGGPSHENHKKLLLDVITECIAPGTKDVKEYWKSKRYYTGLAPMAMPDDGDDLETPVVTLVIKH